MRLPAAPRSFPLRGLMASRYRGECVSTPHQGWSELHRHPKRVLRLSRVSSLSPEDQSSELTARFLVNGSHLRPVVRRLDAVLGQKHPQRVHLAQQATREPSRVVLRGHDTGRSACTAGHTTPATPHPWVGRWPYDRDVAAPPAPRPHRPRGLGCSRSAKPRACG